MKKKYLLALLLTVLITACHKKDNPAKTTQVDFTGTWQEQEQAVQFAGTTYRFMFNGVDSSFHLRLYYFTDIINPNDSCSSAHTAYIKGHYNVAIDTVFLNGNYCDSSFSTVQPGCSGVTTFSETHVFQKTADTIMLNSDFTANKIIPIKLVKQ